MKRVPHRVVSCHINNTATTNNKQCGLWVRPTQYAPARLWPWPFDSETGVQVASKVGNIPSKFEHARPLDCWSIHYVRNGGQTDEQKQRLLPASLQSGLS